MLYLNHKTIAGIVYHSEKKKETLDNKRRALVIQTAVVVCVCVKYVRTKALSLTYHALHSN